jgi:hypothetical protein
MCLERYEARLTVTCGDVCVYNLGLAHCHSTFRKRFEHHPDESFVEKFASSCLSQNSVSQITERTILEIELIAGDIPGQNKSSRWDFF